MSYDKTTDWAEMATVTGSKLVNEATTTGPRPEDTDGLVDQTDLTAAAGYLDTPEARHYRELLANHAGDLPTADQGPTPQADPVPVTVLVDPYLAALICQHQMGERGMVNVQTIGAVASVVGGYLSNLVATTGRPEVDVDRWVEEIHRLQIEEVGQVDASEWPAQGGRS